MSEEHDEKVSAEDNEITQPMQALEIETTREMPVVVPDKVVAPDKRLNGRAWLLLLLLPVPVIGLGIYVTIGAGAIDPGLPYFSAALGYIAGLGMATIFQKKWR